MSLPFAVCTPCNLTSHVGFAVTCQRVDCKKIPIKALSSTRHPRPPPAFDSKVDQDPIQELGQHTYASDTSQFPGARRFYPSHILCHLRCNIDSTSITCARTTGPASKLILPIANSKSKARRGASSPFPGLYFCYPLPTPLPSYNSDQHGYGAILYHTSQLPCTKRTTLYGSIPPVPHRQRRRDADEPISLITAQKRGPTAPRHPGVASVPPAKITHVHPRRPAPYRTTPPRITPHPAPQRPWQHRQPRWHRDRATCKPALDR